MTYKLLPTEEFERQFKKLDPQAQRRVKKKLQEVAQDPTRYKRLHYDLSGSLRLRIGKHRVVYSYDEDAKEVYLETIISDHDYR